MKGKFLLVLVPLLSIAGLLVTPALAVPVYPNVEACGFACERISCGSLSGCASLYVAVEATDGVVTAPTDTLAGGYVILCVCGYEFEWQISESSLKCKCDVLTLCAYPYSVLSVANDPSPFVTPLSPIYVTIDLCKPYCVTATGCSTFFVGQGHTVADG